jgi:hypothetical protein
MPRILGGAMTPPAKLQSSLYELAHAATAALPESMVEALRTDIIDAITEIVSLPPSPETPTSIQLPSALLDRVESLRAKFPLPPSQTEMIVWLIENSLDQIAKHAAEIRRNRDKHDPHAVGKSRESRTIV